MIRRLTAQRACLDWACADIAALPGPALEFGLGNGRSYDHLRTRLPGRDIYVFDLQVAAHPACTPAAERMVLGDFRATAPAAASRFADRVALIHADVGSSDVAASRMLAADLVAYWTAMLRCDGVLVSDQPVEYSGLVNLDIAPEASQRYYAYRRVAAIGRMANTPS